MRRTCGRKGRAENPPRYAEGFIIGIPESIYDDFLRAPLKDVYKRIRPGWKRAAVLLFCLASVSGVVGYLHSLRSERTDLQAKVATLTDDKRHAEQMLAPFQAAALKAFPDADRVEALERLTRRVGSLADDLAAQRVADVGAQLENCFTELVRATAALEALTKASMNGVTDDVPQTTACARLAESAELPAWIRSRLVLYTTSIPPIQGIQRKLSDQCSSGRLQASSFDGPRELAGRVLELANGTKDLVSNQLLVRGKQLPVEEHVDTEGRHSISIVCPAPSP